MQEYFSMMTPEEQELLATVARELAPGSQVLEVGSWLMGSSIIMARANPNIVIWAVDPFDGVVTERMSLEYCRQFPEFQGSRTLALAEAIARPYANIRCVQAESPHNLPEMAKEWALYFEDGNHDDPLLKANLDCHLARVNRGGLLALHDLDQPAVAAHIVRLETEGWREVRREHSLCLLQRLD